MIPKYLVFCGTCGQEGPGSTRDSWVSRMLLKSNLRVIPIDIKIGSHPNDLDFYSTLFGWVVVLARRTYVYVLEPVR